jgi:hypothetical protein
VKALVSSLSTAIKNEESNERDRTTFKHLFTNKTTFRNLIIMAVNWIGVVVAWFGLVMSALVNLVYIGLLHGYHAHSVTINLTLMSLNIA